jgi:hypothetical protein
MQKRLIASAVGGLVGLGLAYRFQNDLGTPETLTYIGCAVAGLAIGWVASTLFDVFTASPDATPRDANK